jgi:heptosyltransferase-3
MYDRIPQASGVTGLGGGAVSVRSILVIAVPAMGDVLLCTPLLAALRRAHAQAAIHVLVRRGHAAVLEGNPDVDGVVEYAKGQALREYLAQARRLFRAYDLVLSNSISSRAAFYALLAGRRRVSVVAPDGDGASGRRRWWSRLYHLRVPLDPRLHTLTQSNRLGESIGLAPGPRITPPRAADGAARLADLLGPQWQEDAYAVVHPAPALAYKRWHAGGWRATVAHLRKRGLQVLITGGGSAEEMAYLEQLWPGSAGVSNLAGRLRLADVTALLEHCAVFVGVDTLVTHLAAGVGAPTVAIFGPTNPVTWGPWPQAVAADRSPFQPRGSQQVGNVFLLQGPAPCVPCGKQGCLDRRDSHSDCLLALTAAQVIRAVDRCLAVRSAAGAAGS